MPFIEFDHLTSQVYDYIVVGGGVSLRSTLNLNPCTVNSYICERLLV